MGRSRFVNGDSTRLDLSDGDWILVKHRLNTGERRAMFARCYVSGPDGEPRRGDAFHHWMALVSAYLLDWSLLDEDGKPVVIRDKPPADLSAILDNLDPEDFTEIRRAVEAHEQAVDAAREAEKKTRTGETGSAVTLPSPSATAGGSSGLLN